MDHDSLPQNILFGFYDLTIHIHNLDTERGVFLSIYCNIKKSQEQKKSKNKLHASVGQ